MERYVCRALGLMRRADRWSDIDALASGSHDVSRKSRHGRKVRFPAIGRSKRHPASGCGSLLMMVFICTT